MSMEWLFLVAMVAGIVGSMAGLGGSVILIPILTSVGVGVKQAIAASILSGIAVSCSAASNYVRGHLTNLKVSAFLELFAVSGALVGASIGVVLNPRLLFVFCGTVLVASCAVLWKQRQREWQPASGPAVSFRTLSFQGSYYDYTQHRTTSYHGRHAGLGGICMFGTGVLTGLLGVGGSAFAVLIQDVVMGLPPKVAVTTSNLILGSMALAGACVYLEARLIESHLVVPIILGVFIGGLFGSTMLVRVTNRTVRRFVLSVIIVWGLEMVFQGVRGS